VDRAKAYRALFNGHISDTTLDEIRKATNKAWVLGSNYFKEKIEKQIKRPASPKKKGGDRKSSEYHRTNRV